ncbi:hypothetical protein [Dechloromonas denitrificans]|nr:hypothetical protein [Dechloromonas denitrificans]UCV03314.1 hypothetical protein KI611_19970 [Dechloromonas denitrificans]UCV07596.1 hypothetical protein KI615_19780 [Dechloromonas denitrificans]
MRANLSRHRFFRQLGGTAALKRLLAWQGHSFSPAVFHTRRLFAASQA